MPKPLLDDSLRKKDMRNYESFNSVNINVFKQGLISFIKDKKYAVIMDSNHFAPAGKGFDMSYDWIAAIGAIQVVAPNKDLLSTIQQSLDEIKDWWFGFIGYDLKNETESLSSGKTDYLNFPGCLFFLPEVVIYGKGETVTIGCYSHTNKASIAPNWIFDQISALISDTEIVVHAIKFQARTGKEKYLEQVDRLLSHIRRGDIYEVNYCIEFFANQVEMDALAKYQQLQKKVPSPFSSFFRMNNNYILCSSPERYLFKKGQRLITQPMKGTAPRGLTPGTDALLKEQLYNNEKERAENVMIVDLVRNDLSRIAERNSVLVDELFGIYTFSKVHQMVSTVTCFLKPEINFSTIIKSTFPMGSMTGAPKIRAMELIDHYEENKRSAFSGTVGYINPEGDFDFNVLIRSFMYNGTSKYLSVQSGSAITANSDPALEFEECLLKAGYMIEGLGGSILNDSLV